MSGYKERWEIQIDKSERLDRHQIRIMKILQRVVNCGFKITVRDFEFVVTTPEHFIEIDKKEFLLDIIDDSKYNSERVRLEQYVSYVEQMTGIDEERIREEAMSKLTGAEIAVLKIFWKRSSDALTKDRP